MSVRDLESWSWGLYLTCSPRLSFWVKAVTSSLSSSLPQSLPWVHSPGRQLKTHLAVGDQRGVASQHGEGVHGAGVRWATASLSSCPVVVVSRSRTCNKVFKPQRPRLDSWGTGPSPPYNLAVPPWVRDTCPATVTALPLLCPRSVLQRLRDAHQAPLRQRLCGLWPADLRGCQRGRDH